MFDILMVKCLRCGYQWRRPGPDKPRMCPKCKSPGWDTFPKPDAAPPEKPEDAFGPDLPDRLPPQF